MSEEQVEKNIWKAEIDTAPAHLEAVLNALVEDGYQVHSLHLRSTEGTDDEEPYVYDVVAFDATRLMQKQTEAMQAQMNAIMGTAGTPPSR